MIQFSATDLLVVPIQSLFLIQEKRIVLNSDPEPDGTPWLRYTVNRCNSNSKTVSDSV